MILRYGLSSHEARACKIQFIFIEQVHKVFPEAVGFRYPKYDPRKTYAFKFCYKLLRTTQHKIRDIDYPLYVRAQLDIIKINTKRTEKEPDISIRCLVGKQAWNRWLVWKKIYDYRLHKRAKTAKEAGVDANEHERVVMTLASDKKFLVKRLKSLTKDTTQKAVSDRLIPRWVATKQLSPYYALLSPILRTWLEERNLTIEDVFRIDFGFYRPGITNEIQNHFSHEFAHETG
jgi:hypothetical protein